ncbi:cytochrome c family protein [Limibaculum sp. M0105]|uniref:Cytochrome c family protein n=1 Tax=Thermohalobaculum xanthum TaxID=2753746 RepID=A0A8J7SDI1_9RHOB|nr:cytochrome c family protein [Thermohalobaculum xanthum]MBK0398442.1 cytochrome c family protein [Thermohalobaculum xanthum]
MKRIASIAAAVAALSIAGAAHAGDADAGKKVFNKCKACHKLEEGKNGVGPTLFGLSGRPVGSVEGYKYSDAMMAYADGGKVWDEAALNEFLANPKGTVPGTKMAFAGLKKPEDIANVIAFIEAN